jgi:iron complex transport system permease protein
LGRIKIISLVLLIILTLAVTPFIGGISIGIGDIFTGGTGQQIFFDLRLPRIVFAFLVGFSLALIGAVFQALLRNDLATPYTLGVSSGGSLGAVLAIKTGFLLEWAGFPAIVIFSVGGSLSTILIIYMIARSRYGLSPLTLILTGVTISLLFSSMILFIHYLADFTETYRMIRWLMGGLQISGWQYPLTLLPVSVVTFLFLYRHAPAINILSTGHEMALSKGVDVSGLQKRIFFGGSVLIGVVVGFAGPIGFIGLIIPHLIRLLTGPDHRVLLPAAAAIGGIFLVWCDTAARTIIAPAELPVGILTAMIGGPFFIWLLLRHRMKQ